MTIPRNTPTLTIDAPTLQFASGRTLARFTPTAKFTSLVGFHSEAGKAPELDHLLAELKVPRIEIKHQRPGGSEVKPHWYFGEALRFYPITAGPVAPTIAGCLRRAPETADAGIGVRWADGERSKLALRGFMAVVVGDAWTMPILQIVQLVAKSKMTDRLLRVLLDHLRVVTAADGLIKRDQHPDPVAFHELPLQLAAGAEEEWGKGETATVTPLMSAHPAQIDLAYVSGLWRPRALHEAAIAEWPLVQQWAAEYAAGVDGDLNGHVE